MGSQSISAMLPRLCLLSRSMGEHSGELVLTKSPSCDKYGVKFSDVQDTYAQGWNLIFVSTIPGTAKI